MSLQWQNYMLYSTDPSTRVCRSSLVWDSGSGVGSVSATALR